MSGLPESARTDKRTGSSATSGSTGVTRLICANVSHIQNVVKIELSTPLFTKIV